MAEREWPTAHLSWHHRFLPDADRERAIEAACARARQLQRTGIAGGIPITVVIDEPPIITVRRLVEEEL